MRLLLVCALVTAIPPTTANADERAPCTEPSDAAVVARLRVLEQHVRHEEPLVRRWFTTFAFLHSAMALGGAILAAQGDSHNVDFRNEMLVNMTSSALALASLVVVGPPLLGAGSALDGMGEDTPEARLLKLRIAEDILRRASAAVEFATGWFPATASAVYVTGAATTLLVGLGRVNAAYTHSIGGAVLGLGRILLRPTGARAAWRRYRRAHPDALCEEEERVAEGPEASWRVVPSGFGLGLQVEF